MDPSRTISLIDISSNDIADERFVKGDRQIWLAGEAAGRKRVSFHLGPKQNLAELGSE
jgi:hypothetical protein